MLGDRDERVIMKTLGLLRNLLSNTLHIETIMSEHSSEVLRAVSVGKGVERYLQNGLLIMNNGPFFVR